MPSFVAIDVETANADMASICQIGAAVFERGEMVDHWSSLVDPNDYFDPVNVSIHGITVDDGRGASMCGAASEVLGAIVAGKEPDATVTIQNNVPYSGEIEDGHSDQAIDGVFSQAFAAVRAKYSKS